MKKIFFLCLTVVWPYFSMAQKYHIQQVRTVAEIWGESYLFHPSIVRADRNVEWEKELVHFLPRIKQQLADDEFIRVVNDSLLKFLDDPLTLVQGNSGYEETKIKSLTFNKEIDYLKLSGLQLTSYETIALLDSLIADKVSDKPLILDIRIGCELDFDKHSNTPFDYFLSMFIDDEIPESKLISREHFGWDEYNDWWFYEQHWKVKARDKQIKGNGSLMPLKTYEPVLQSKLAGFSFGDAITIKRPVYFLVNTPLLGYFRSQLLAIRENRNNTFIIHEKSGQVFPSTSDLYSYKFPQCQFVLNAGLYYNRGVGGLIPDLSTAKINEKQLLAFINSPKVTIAPKRVFQLDILPRKYSSRNNKLTQEEKILGIVKLWTVVKYFNAWPERCSINWENSLSTFLSIVLETNSDKEYYIAIQKIMSSLNDSHVSTFHPSILDFSSLFIAPIMFDWIESKVIVTAIDSSVHNLVSVGDEIVSIDEREISEILEEEAMKVSHSNTQGILSTVINPGYFIGANGSNLKMKVLRNDKLVPIDVPRSMYVFQMESFKKEKPGVDSFPGNIAYLNLAAFAEKTSLEQALKKLSGSDALILDLRSSYPTADFSGFLEMLCNKKTVIRKSEVNIVDVDSRSTKHVEQVSSIITPNGSFSYEKQIVVLIDKTMISRPEDIAIALSAFPNVKFVGEQTQGTDGEMTRIHLPGGGETSFTGQRVFFGNGDKFQGVGIIPDVEVKQTIEAITGGRDEVLEKALKLCRE